MNDDKLSLNGCGGVTRRATNNDILKENECVLKSVGFRFKDKISGAMQDYMENASYDNTEFLAIAEKADKKIEDLENHLKLYLDLLATKKGTDAEYISWLNKAKELLK